MNHYMPSEVKEQLSNLLLPDIANIIEGYYNTTPHKMGFLANVRAGNYWIVKDALERRNLNPDGDCKMSGEGYMGKEVLKNAIKHAKARGFTHIVKLINERIEYARKNPVYPPPRVSKIDKNLYNYVICYSNQKINN